MRARLIAVSLIVLLVVSAGFAAKGSAVKLTAVFDTQSGFGVSGDGNAYIDGINAVQCYFGVAGKDLDLVTYNTTRKAHFAFDSGSVAWQSSGLSSASFDGTIDFYGVNFYGPFASMGVGTTAQMPGSLQFKDPTGVTTYELYYSALAVKRTGSSTWMITSDPAAIGGYPGFTASSQAKLSMIRKRGSVPYGNVDMPISFTVNKF